MTAGDTAMVQVPAAGTYRIDPEKSTVGYRGRHMFGLGVVRATFAVTEGVLTVTDPPTASTIAVALDAGSFASGNAKRDKDVRSASLLDVETYPAITFASDAVRPEGAGWLAAGSVTAHGSTVPVDLRIDRMTPEGGGFRVHATAAHLDRYAFGVTGSKGMVGRYLDIDLDVFATRA